MGIRRPRYGEACKLVREAIRSEMANALANGNMRLEQVHYFTELCLGSMHKVPSWALRTIADASDPDLPNNEGA